MVQYKGVLLARNSEAFVLYTNKQWGLLDKHLARLKAESIKRGDYYEFVHE